MSATTSKTPASADPHILHPDAVQKPSSSTSSSSSSSKGITEDAKKLAEEVKGKTSGVKTFIAGGVGGLGAVLVGQPFDMVD